MNCAGFFSTAEITRVYPIRRHQAQAVQISVSEAEGRNLETRAPALNVGATLSRFRIALRKELDLLRELVAQRVAQEVNL